MPDAPAATPVLSTTSTSSPERARCQAVESTWTPAPTTRKRTDEGSEAAMARQPTRLYQFAQRLGIVAAASGERRARGTEKEASRMNVDGNGSVALGAAPTFVGTVATVMETPRIAP